MLPKKLPIPDEFDSDGRKVLNMMLVFPIPATMDLDEVRDEVYRRYSNFTEPKMVEDLLVIAQCYIRICEDLRDASVGKLVTARRFQDGINNAKATIAQVEKNVKGE